MENIGDEMMPFEEALKHLKIKAKVTRQMWGNGGGALRLEDLNSPDCSTPPRMFIEYEDGEEKEVSMFPVADLLATDWRVL